MILFGHNLNRLKPGLVHPTNKPSSVFTTRVKERRTKRKTARHLSFPHHTHTAVHHTHPPPSTAFPKCTVPSHNHTKTEPPPMQNKNTSHSFRPLPLSHFHRTLLPKNKEPTPPRLRQQCSPPPPTTTQPSTTASSSPQHDSSAAAVASPRRSATVSIPPTRH